MRRARLRTTVNLAAAQNRRRQVEKTDPQELTTSSAGSHKTLSEITSDISQKETNDTRQEIELSKAAGDVTVSCSSDQTPTTRVIESIEISDDLSSDRVESTRKGCEKRGTSPSRETQEDPYSKKSNVITFEETKESELKSKEDGTASEKLEGTGFSKEVLESNNVKSTESAAVSFDYHPKEHVSFKWFNFCNFRTLNTFDVCELCLINS